MKDIKYQLNLLKNHLIKKNNLFYIKLIIKNFFIIHTQISHLVVLINIYFNLKYLFRLEWVR
jgi:hypothetical protein